MIVTDAVGLHAAEGAERRPETERNEASRGEHPTRRSSFDRFAEAWPRLVVAGR